MTQTLGEAMHTRIFILALVLAGAALQTSCEPHCTGNSKAAQYARSLPQDRMRKLYFDMERYSQDDSTPIDGWYVSNGRDIPEPFRDLKVARIRPRKANIMVEGCMDEFMYLDFAGFGGKGPRSITLSYPVTPEKYASEVLWKD